MRTRLLNLLLLLALALAGLRLWHFLGEAPPGLPAPAAGTASAPAAPAAPVAAPEVPAEPALPESYEVIVARDLFSSSRGVVPPAPVLAAKPVAKPQPAPKLTLSGVVILDNERSAFLQEGSGEARPRKVKEGERFAGGTVSAIRPDGVTFQFGGAEVVIPLRTPKDGAGPAGAPGGGVPGAGDQRPAAQSPFPRRFVQPATQPHNARPGVPAAGTMPGVPQFVPPPALPEEDVIDEEDPLSEDEGDLLEEETFPDSEDDSGAE